MVGRFGRRERREEPPTPVLEDDRQAPPDPVTPPTVLGGRYVLGRVLGNGGEASVYLAEDRALGREVAVKLFHRQPAPPSQGSLQQVEARVGAALNHYALTSLIDAGIGTAPDGAPQLYLVMEYVAGETLAARLRRGPMEASEACWLGFDLAEGLSHMHQTGFLHRDVKPSNILISGIRSVRPVVAKLTDFGIAAPVGEPDLSEFTIGTAAYLSPEQVEGDDARPASDVYSLGLVLLEAMTGVLAFPGSVTVSAFDRLTRDPEIPRSIPPRTAALLRRMTARDPERRIDLYDAAVELQQILVDDLLQRRGAGPVAAQQAPIGDVAQVVEQVRPGFETALRLLVSATGATKAVLLLTDAGGPPVIAAEHGWAQHPHEIRTRPVRPSDPSRQGGTWSIGDVLQEPGLVSHPLAAPPHDVRAAAGTVLLGPDGVALGTLSVFDERPRSFTEPQLQSLRDCAELLARDIQLRLAVRRVLFPQD